MPGALRQLAEPAARRPRELERAQVVVREHLGEVLGAVAGQALDPLGGEPVRVGAPRARDLRVGDVADEDVAEDEGGLAGDRGAALAAHELLALERAGGPPRPRARGRSPSAASAPTQKTFPTTAASWSERLLLGRPARRGAPR